MHIKELTGDRLVAVELTKKCLERIREMAESGVQSSDALHVGHTLIYLTATLTEHATNQEEVEAPDLSDRIAGLHKLESELDMIERVLRDELASRITKA